MTSRRDLCLRVVALLACIASGVGCSYGPGRGPCCRRAAFALLVPKLDLRWQLARTQSQVVDTTARVHTGVSAWLRWQPSLYAAQVPSRYELSPAAWASPCNLDDAACFAELAESERELDDALQEER
jgi:hypothetical protein